MKTYNLFISHSWRYGDQYDRLYSLLRARRYFAFKDYSVSHDDPIHDAATDAQLRRAIRDQMTPCHVVLILAGVYASYNKWIDIEIDLAKKGALAEAVDGSPGSGIRIGAVGRVPSALRRVPGLGGASWAAMMRLSCCTDSRPSSPSSTTTTAPA